jgi:putative FmdB family regulatory protein
MPLYEYICRACTHRFEALVRGAPPSECPQCGRSNLERELSLFAVNSEQTRQSSLAKARRANYKVEKDKAIADEEYKIKHHD